MMMMDVALCQGAGRVSVLVPVVCFVACLLGMVSIFCLVHTPNLTSEKFITYRTVRYRYGIAVFRRQMTPWLLM